MRFWSDIDDSRLWSTRNSLVALGIVSKLAWGVRDDSVATVRVRARLPSAEDADTRRNSADSACRPLPTTCGDYWEPVPDGVPDPGISRSGTLQSREMSEN